MFFFRKGVGHLLEFYLLYLEKYTFQRKLKLYLLNSIDIFNLIYGLSMHSSFL